MIQKFVRKVEVGTHSFKILYIVDKDRYKRELALQTGSQLFKKNPKMLRPSDRRITNHVGAQGLALAELEVLRWTKGLSKRQLAEKYGKTEGAIQNHFQVLRRKNFEVPG